MSNPQDAITPLVCPKCRTVIDPAERCEAGFGIGQCMDKQGHEGWHWTDLGRGDGGIRIWTGLYSRHSCPGRLGVNDRWCVKPVGHDGMHNDGRGTSFGDPLTEEEMEALDA